MKKLLTLIAGVSFLVISCGKITASINTKEELKQEKANETKNIKMILDLDTGIDDAMALAYALGNPNIEVIGVTTVFGNVTQQTSAYNTLDLLDLLNHKEIPVYAGAEKPTGATAAYEPRPLLLEIHGNNGVGNVKLEKSTRQVEKQDAADFIIESAKKYGKDLYIVAVGPQTNLAAAIKKDPKLGEQAGKIVTMGGVLIIEGNTTSVSEANIYNDPIAASEFYGSGTPFTMVGLDVTHRTLLTKTDTQKWRDLGTTSGKTYADIVDYYIDWETANLPVLTGCALHDPLAVGVAMHPEYVKTLKLPMKVITSGNDIGRTVAVTEKLNDPNAANVDVAVDVEVESFVSDFNATLNNLFSKN